MKILTRSSSEYTANDGFTGGNAAATIDAEGTVAIVEAVLADADDGGNAVDPDDPATSEFEAPDFTSAADVDFEPDSKPDEPELDVDRDSFGGAEADPFDELDSVSTEFDLLAVASVPEVDSNPDEPELAAEVDVG